MEPSVAARPAAWRLFGVLVAAAAAAIATTRLAPHVAPSALVLIVAAIAATAIVALPERRARGAAWIGAAIVGALSSHVLWRSGMPQVHDPDHVWGLWAYARAVHAGHLLPMWIPDLGAGMPLLQFYGPVSFLLALPGIAAGLAPVELWKEAMIQAAVLSAVATALGARLLGVGRRASLIAAGALAFAPWKLAVFHLRGALGEVTALVAAPLVAASALALLRGRSRAAAWTLGLSTAVLIPTHLITLFCLGVTLVPAAIVQEMALRRAGGAAEPVGRRLAAACVPPLLAAGLVAAWWIPAFAEGNATSLPLQTEHHNYFVYEEHGVGLSDLSMRRAWDTLRSSLKASDRAAGMEGRQMPFYVGGILFGAALTSPWWSRSRATWAPAAGAAAAVVFATAPAARAMTLLPAIHKIQFPWRFLTAGSILAAYAVAAGADALLDAAPSWKRAWPVLVLPALLVGDAAPYTGAAGWVAPYSGLTHWVRVEGTAEDAPFDVAMRPVPQPDWNPPGLGRAGGLYLPPSRYDTRLSLFWIAYVEWTTPAIYRGFVNARGPRDFADAAVVAFFLERREVPAAVAGAPYATLEGRDGTADAGPFTREAGHVALHPVVPAGGASLVVREQAFPGWEAFVDGAEVAPAATSLGFMSIRLPEGAHDVTLDYTRHTPARRAGIAVSVLSAMVGGAVLIVRRRRTSRGFLR